MYGTGEKKLMARKPKNVPKPELPMVCLLATDWSGVDTQVSFNQAQKFSLMQAWIMGFVVSEDEEKITLARDHFFDDEEVRSTITISKVTVDQRIDFSV